MVKAIDFRRIIAIGIIIHVLISLFIIFFPSVLKNTWLQRVYSSYLMPGPFFSEDRITDTYYLSLTWEEQDSHKSETVDPAFKNYKEFYLTGNPKFLYRSRLDNSLYQRILFKKDSLKEQELKRTFTSYYKFRYVPQTSDSATGIFLRRRTKNFKTSLDTLQTIEF
ncbi:MAG: hypothetical protein JNM78_19020 [Cyclobacteriaceae bacterium]|nr:hypothetical protein [Cyclobacteriaceae bacterium]